MHGNSLIDIKGKRFGILTIIEYDERSRWKVKCDCGVEKTMRGDHIRNGKYKSCGECRKKKANAKFRGTPIYNCWVSMRQRCFNPKAEGYENNGGKGISVCWEWLDFENFYNDMGEPPKGHELARMDLSQDYSFLNCDWLTPRERAVNKKFNLKGE